MGEIEIVDRRVLVYKDDLKETDEKRRKVDSQFCIENFALKWTFPRYEVRRKDNGAKICMLEGYLRNFGNGL